MIQDIKVPESILVSRMWSIDWRHIQNSSDLLFERPLTKISSSRHYLKYIKNG